MGSRLLSYWDSSSFQRPAFRKAVRALERPVLIPTIILLPGVLLENMNLGLPQSDRNTAQPAAHKLNSDILFQFCLEPRPSF